MNSISMAFAVGILIYWSEGIRKRFGSIAASVFFLTLAIGILIWSGALMMSQSPFSGM